MRPSIPPRSFRPRSLSFAATLFTASALLACAGTQVLPAGPPSTVSPGLLNFSEEGMNAFTATLPLALEAPADATVVRVDSELVVDGRVVEKRQDTPGLALAANDGATLPVAYAGIPHAGEKDAASAGPLLVAIRGTVTVTRGGAEETLPFARSRELRRPRQPTISLREVVGARYSEELATVTARLAITNHNPFPVRIDELRYRATFGGKAMDEGRRGRAALIAPSSTDLYEVEVRLDPDSYGPGIVTLIAGRDIPYQLEGTLEGQGLSLPFSLEGGIRLNVSR